MGRKKGRKGKMFAFYLSPETVSIARLKFGSGLNRLIDALLIKILNGDQDLKRMDEQIEAEKSKLSFMEKQREKMFNEKVKRDFEAVKKEIGEE